VPTTELNPIYLIFTLIMKKIPEEADLNLDV